MELWDLRFDGPTEFLREFLLGRGPGGWVVRNLQLNMLRREGCGEGATTGTKLKTEAR
jgi:hypothetical protein